VVSIALGSNIARTAFFDCLPFLNLISGRIVASEPEVTLSRTSTGGFGRDCSARERRRHFVPRFHPPLRVRDSSAMTAVLRIRECLLDISTDVMISSASPPHARDSQHVSWLTGAAFVLGLRSRFSQYHLKET
jgi:hypothetical protein